MGSSGSGSSVPSPHAPAANTNQRPAHDYVAMNKYDEGQLMRDYQFLSDIGRKVGSWGRTLSQQKWAANAQIANGPSQQSNNPGNQRPERLTAAQQKREALRKQINFRRLQIMLLPDGMEQRRANHTVWHNK